MKVVITDVTSAHDVVMASGLSVWLKEMGVSCEAPSVPLALVGRPSAQAVAKSDPVPLEVSAPVRRKLKAAKKTKPVPAVEKKDSAPSQSSAASSDRPHVTIRQRVLNALQGGPKTANEVRQLLGVDVDASQHLYLLKRAGLVTLSDDTSKYSLTGGAAR